VDSSLAFIIGCCKDTIFSWIIDYFAEKKNPTRLAECFFNTNIAWSALPSVIPSSGSIQTLHISKEPSPASSDACPHNYSKKLIKSYDFTSHLRMLLSFLPFKTFALLHFCRLDFNVFESAKGDGMSTLRVKH
jgi:hypothetical protein